MCRNIALSVIGNWGSVFVFRTPMITSVYYLCSAVHWPPAHTAVSALIGRCCALRQEVFHEEGEGLTGRRRATEPG